MADTNKKTTLLDALIIGVAVAIPLYLFDQWLRDKNGSGLSLFPASDNPGGPGNMNNGSYNGYDYQEKLAEKCTPEAVPVRIVETEPCIFPPDMLSEFYYEPGNVDGCRQEWGVLNPNNYMMENIYPYNLGRK